MPERIYLDHAATTPILPAAKAAVAEAMERWANPSSPHAEGRAAHAALEEARSRIKAALGWDGDLIFTSGASEALAVALGRTDRRVLASAVEHDAVFRAAPDAQILPVGPKGQVSRGALDDALHSGPPAMVAVQHVNSETGVVQPIEMLAAQVREAGGLLICDCAQSAAKLPLPDADMIVVSAHKLGGPPGIGALLVRDLGALKASGGQERGYRPGTQNLPGALGFAVALEWCGTEVLPDGAELDRPTAKWVQDLGPHLAVLEHEIQSGGGIYQPALSGAPIHCGWIRAVTIPGMNAAAQLIRFDAAGIAVSAGSACSSGSLKPSRALQAFGVPETDAACTIRVSFGWSTTADEIGRFLDAWLAMARHARSRAA